jgi:hypothetical protein
LYAQVEAGLVAPLLESDIVLGEPDALKTYCFGAVLPGSYTSVVVEYGLGFWYLHDPLPSP